MSKKKASLEELEKSDSEHSEDDENEELLNTTQKTSKSQDYISSKAKSDVVSRSVKHQKQNPEFNIPNQKKETTSLSSKEKEVNSRLQQLEKEVAETEIKFTNQPILLLNIDNSGKILLNKKALHLLKKISTYVK